MKSFCQYYNQDICQSCDIIKLDYASQIIFKENSLKETLEGLYVIKFLPTVTSDHTYFRNKAKFHVTSTFENPILGLLGKEDLDSGRDISECPLHKKKITAMIPFIKEFIYSAQLHPYQASIRHGELKGIIIFYSEESNESYIRFILRSKESLDRIKKFHSKLLNQIPHLKVISVNLQPIPHAIFEGEEEIIITNSQYISQSSAGINYFLNPKGFVQTNQKVAEKLYLTASEWINESHLSKLLELFCGQGAFSFHAAPYIKKGLGIEVNPEAVKIANETALNYKHYHLTFQCADAYQLSDQIKEFSPEIILVNPPRRGLGETVNYLLLEEPLKIIYSSCNADSLKKDLNKLLTKYEITKIQIFDMFPNTSHYETLIELNLKTHEVFQTLP